MLTQSESRAIAFNILQFNFFLIVRKYNFVTLGVATMTKGSSFVSPDVRLHVALLSSRIYVIQRNIGILYAAETIPYFLFVKLLLISYFE